eukprot:scaffold21812_cov110-Isochrysis_galbana.AAC.6
MVADGQVERASAQRRLRQQQVGQADAQVELFQSGTDRTGKALATATSNCKDDAQRQMARRRRMASNPLVPRQEDGRLRQPHAVHGRRARRPVGSTRGFRSARQPSGLVRNNNTPSPCRGRRGREQAVSAG